MPLKGGNEMNVSIELVKEVLVYLAEIYLKEDDQILFVIDQPFADIPVEPMFVAWPHDVVVIPKVERPGQDYELDESLLKDKTVGWLISSVSISHAQSTKKMIDAGLFLISNPNITPDWPATLTREANIICAYRAHHLLSFMSGGKEDVNPGGKIKVSDDYGTMLTLSVPANNWDTEIGDREGMGTNGPFGELANIPYDANGVYVLCPGDWLTNPINEVTEEIRLTIKGNLVVDIQGGEQAEQLRQVLKKADNLLAYSLGEFSIQLNPFKPDKLYTSVIAEKLEGGMHLAIGSNHMLIKDTCPPEERAKLNFGVYDAGVHIDCITFGKKVEWNKKENSSLVLLNKGRLIVR
ncbi:MAG: hypothetical protein GF365_02280 [Candidatus Buchananbacteria bacterium]|nr:hypothetical protein [Candidatus Buchananbacteria bacterium]